MDGIGATVHHHHEVVAHVDEDVQNVRLSIHPMSTRGEWMKPTEVWCWHCCHSFESTPVYVPDSVTFDSDGEKMYMVFGNFCSLQCAKTHILSQKTFSANKQLMLLNSMAVDIYQSILPIPTAPPKICLKRFGGSMTIEEFRGTDSVHITCSEPPFQSADVVISTFDRKPRDNTRGTQEGDADTSPGSRDYNTWSVRDIRRPDISANAGDIANRGNGTHGGHGASEANGANAVNKGQGAPGPARARRVGGMRSSTRLTGDEADVAPQRGLRKFLKS